MKPGDIIDEYTILSLINHGGMRNIYQVEHNGTICANVVTSYCQEMLRV